jgi:predicted dehydrogenase
VRHITTRFTFTIGPGNETNYRWDPLQGGGALLDVGIYALGPAVALWGSEPDHVTAEIDLTAEGIDHTTRCELRWEDGRTSSSVMSFAMPEAQELRLSGPDLDLQLSGNAHTGVDGTYERMIDAVCADVRGEAEFPRPIDDAVAMLGLLERIRTA